MTNAVRFYKIVNRVFKLALCIVLSVFGLTVALRTLALARPCFCPPCPLLSLHFYQFWATSARDQRDFKLGHCLDAGRG